MFLTHKSNGLEFFCESCDEIVSIPLNKVWKLKHRGLKREDKYVVYKGRCPQCNTQLETKNVPERGRGSRQSAVARATNRVPGTDIRYADKIPTCPPPDLEQALEEEKRLRKQREQDGITEDSDPSSQDDG